MFTFLSYSNYSAIFSSKDYFLNHFSLKGNLPLLATKALSNSFTFSELIHTTSMLNVLKHKKRYVLSNFHPFFEGKEGQGKQNI